MQDKLLQESKPLAEPSQNKTPDKAQQDKTAQYISQSYQKQSLCCKKKKPMQENQAEK